MHLTLLNILQDSAGEWRGPQTSLTQPIHRVSTDSRTVQAGDLFFALVGDKYDGHQFVPEVLARGALAAVVQRSWFAGHAQFDKLVVVPDPLVAFQESAAAFRRRFDIPTVAITGSAGKTTTKEMTYSVLSQKYRILRNRKSFNNHIGVPITLFELQPEHDILVAELGANHFGELDRLSYLVEPSLVVLTNIGHAHLQFFGDLEGVRRAKFEIFNHCRPGAMVVFNADDAMLAGSQLPLDACFGYGVGATADLRAEVLGCDEKGCYRFKVLDRVVRLQVPGRHNIANAMAAAAVGVQFHLSADEIASGLESFTAVDQRMQVISFGGMTLLNDTYNANPASCAAALSTLQDFKHPTGRLIAVLGDMLELGAYTEPEHQRLADLCVAARVDALYLYGTHTAHTFARAKEVGQFEVFYFTDKAQLLESLMTYLRSEDVVLFKGSRGMRMESLAADLLQQ